MESGRIVIVGYQPFSGKEEQLVRLMKDHVAILRNEGLAADRPSIVMQASNGTIIEVFEWKSKEAMEKAHSNPVVQKMWAAYEEVCEYVPIGDLTESASVFSEFTPISI